MPTQLTLVQVLDQRNGYGSPGDEFLRSSAYNSAIESYQAAGGGDLALVEKLAWCLGKTGR